MLIKYQISNININKSAAATGSIAAALGTNKWRGNGKWELGIGNIKERTVVWLYAPYYSTHTPCSIHSIVVHLDTFPLEISSSQLLYLPKILVRSSLRPHLSHQNSSNSRTLDLWNFGTLNPEFHLLLPLYLESYKELLLSFASILLVIHQFDPHKC